MNKKSTNQFIEASIFVCIIMVISMLEFIIPLSIIALPITTYILIKRNGRANAIMAYIVTIILTIFIISITAIFTTTIYGIIGMIFFEINNRKNSFNTNVMSLALIYTVIFILDMYIFIKLISNSSVMVYIEQIVSLNVDIMEKTNFSKEYINNFNKISIYIFPSIILMLNFLNAIIFIKITNTFIQLLKLGKKIKDIPKMENWNMGNLLIIIPLALVVLFNKNLNQDTVYSYIYYTSYYIFIMAITIQGIGSINGLFLKNVKFNKKIKNILIIVFIFVGINIVIVMGFLDYCLDLRNLYGRSIFKKIIKLDRK